MSLTLHMRYRWQESFDDELLMSYSFKEHFLQDDRFALTKNIGYPFYLFLVSKTGLSIDVAQFLLWFIAALIIALALYVMFRKKSLTVFAYVLVLWNPLAFDQDVGQRIYRNSFMVPMLYILLGLMMIPISGKLFNSIEGTKHADAAVANRRNLRTAVASVIELSALGFVFAWFYVTKEDSLWIIPLAATVLIVAAIRTFANNATKSIPTRIVSAMLVMVIPVTISVTGIAACKAINQHYFGVSYLNTRTEGELAKFVNNIYAIENPDQNGTIWAPASSIEQAFEVSPTLAAQPKMLYSIEHDIFAQPNIRQNPLKGDFLTWQMRIAVSESIGWNNEPQVQAFFEQVNNELNQAFEDGRLTKTSKIRLTSSMVPLSQQEINSVFKLSLKSYLNNYLYNNIEPDSKRNDTVPGDDNKNWIGLQRLNIDPSDPSPQYIPFFNYSQASRFAHIMQSTYRIINIVLLVCLLFMTLLAIIRIRKRQSYAYILEALTSWGLVTYSFIYTFAIAWFSQFLQADAQFRYSIGCSNALVTTGLLISLGVLQIYTSIDRRI